MGEVRTSGVPRCSLGSRIPVVGREIDEGIFLNWEWDGRRLTVENDRFGLYPLFYCVKPSSIAISPSLAKVVRVNSNRELDLKALSVFFRLGHFLGEDTPFEDVRFLPPNSVLVWENGVVTVTSRSSVAAAGGKKACTFDEAVETYEALFARSIERRLPKDQHFAVPLSGGRDSRHILLELARQGVTPQSCVTVRYRPPASNEDARIARELAGRLGIEHVELDKPESFFHAELNDVHLTNYCGGGHGWVQPVAAALSGKFNTSYDGLAGEVLSAGFMFSDRKAKLFGERAFDELARLIFEENGGEAVVRRVFSEGFYKKLVIEDAVQKLTSELAKHADSPNPVLSYLFWNRTRRCIASIPFSILYQVPVVHVPFLDHDLFNFLSALDPSVTKNNRLHDETIRRTYPRFTDVPYAEKRVGTFFRPSEKSYYRNARNHFSFYLCGMRRQTLEKIRWPFLVARLAADFVSWKRDGPWYMRPVLQIAEIEKLRDASY